ncbi:hypothetical protein KEM52_001237 [Ascosphaera acerosa]|nr:hypothetical protein KEM52_001237 [Ascosphaera acerosa]
MRLLLPYLHLRKAVPCPGLQVSRLNIPWVPNDAGGAYAHEQYFHLPTISGKNVFYASDAGDPELDKHASSPAFIAKYLLQFSEPHVSWDLVDGEYVGTSNTPTQQFGLLAPIRPDTLFAPSDSLPPLVDDLSLSSDSAGSGSSRAAILACVAAPPGPVLPVTLQKEPRTMENLVFAQPFITEIFRVHGALRSLDSHVANRVATTAIMITAKLWDLFNSAELLHQTGCKGLDCKRLAWLALWNLIRNAHCADNPRLTGAIHDKREEASMAAFRLSDIFGTLEGFSDAQLAALQIHFFGLEFLPRDAVPDESDVDILKYSFVQTVSPGGSVTSEWTYLAGDDSSASIGGYEQQRKIIEEAREENARAWEQQDEVTSQPASIDKTFEASAKLSGLISLIHRSVNRHLPNLRDSMPILNSGIAPR